LKLTGSVLSRIYLGTITHWNDPAIARLNPHATLPALRITPLYRSDSSGTTFNFTDYLSHVSPAWKSRVGVGTSLDWPSGTGAKGSSGLAAALSRTKGGIRYIDVAYSLENNFDYAAIQNRAGTAGASRTRASDRTAGRRDRAAGRPQDDQQHLLSPQNAITARHDRAVTANWTQERVVRPVHLRRRLSWWTLHPCSALHVDTKTQRARGSAGLAGRR